MLSRLRQIQHLRIQGIPKRWLVAVLVPLLVGMFFLIRMRQHGREQERIFNDVAVHGIGTSPGSRSRIRDLLSGTITVGDGNDIHIIGPKVNDTLVVRASRLDQLRILSLMHCPVTDASIPVFEAMPDLQWLSVNGTRISDAGLKRLRAARPKLLITRAYGEELSPAVEVVAAEGGDVCVGLNGGIVVEFHDADVRIWDRRESRYWATTSRTNVTNDSLDSLSPLDRQMSGKLGVWLRHPNLTDEALSKLTPLKNLKWLRVEPGSNISADAIRAFRKVRPDVETDDGGLATPPAQSDPAE